MTNLDHVARRLDERSRQYATGQVGAEDCPQPSHCVSKAFRLQRDAIAKALDDAQEEFEFRGKRGW